MQDFGGSAPLAPRTTFSPDVKRVPVRLVSSGRTACTPPLDPSRPSGGAAAREFCWREEARVAGRIQFKRFWSAFGSAVVDLTDRNEDPLSLSDGFDPLRTRLGVQYEDDCIRLGLTWRRDFVTNGDARAGNSFLLTLALTNLGR